MTNADVVRGAYEAFARGDVLDVLGAMDPQIEWREAENLAYADGNPYIGPKAITEGVFLRLATEWEGYAVTPDRVLEGDNTVVVFGRYSGRYRVTNRTVNAQFAHVWTLRDGKLAAFEQYTDTAQFREVMGSPVAAAI